MNAQNERLYNLSAFQAIALFSSSFLPVMFWIYPTIAVHYARLDAQWSLLCTVLIGVFISWVHGRLNDRFPNMPGPDFACLVWGKWMGKAITALYVPVYLLFLGVSLYFAISLMKYFFPLTMRMWLALAMIVVAWRGAWCGVEAMGRASAIVHPLTFAGILASFGAILANADQPLIPISFTSLSQTASGVYHLLPLYLGMDLILVSSPYYRHRRGKSEWYPVIATAIGGVVVILVFFAIVVNLGFTPTERLAYPVQMVIQLIRLRGFLVERLGIVIIILSVAYTTLFLGNHIWALSSTVARIVGVSDHKFRPFTFFVAPSIFAISQIIAMTTQARDIVTAILAPASWVVVVVIPLCTYLIASLRGIRTDTREEIQPKGRQRRAARRRARRSP
ncbi:GerAB/ArcD/ProY family transporter [Alicyclobacillus sendaiensis]|uniref:GerAB/ArcD/ProY family transporter n=1 Tax=Alicyclobacillus sendaiensis TaxID=192387 RepID=UPI0007823DBD|nr:GerAB/ArcD/ProY family transporter [Alicyclobacillus sendaiensis]